MSSDSVLRRCERECRNLATSHYENFVIASALLPRQLRQPFYNIYAFCRTADDLADESPSPAIALERLSEFQDQLHATFAGHPPENLFLPLAQTIEQFSLIQQPFDNLLSAFRQDQTKTRYQTMDELLDYCRRSANPVGRILLKVAQCSNPENDSLSDEICTGLQLANFWQDVSRDYEIGRVYLPTDQMEKHGLSDKSLGDKTTPLALKVILRQQCDITERYFQRGLPLAKQVPSWFARDVKLFAHGGLTTLHAIRNVDFDVLRVRPKVSKVRQFSLVARAALGWL
ncbi:squalene synthase HpnC [Planctomycetes bacterium K23_9]|uniref:All-trans-phytoene synthase n=1 Tax=Stieleria marina TaxID=1930275 RepID=A0A517NNT1_9BACT|nr:All-trans-phytoene synthase [Planctomycetes bacterium K23_9]